MGVRERRIVSRFDDQCAALLGPNQCLIINQYSTAVCVGGKVNQLHKIPLAPQTPFWSLGEKALFPSVVRGALVECFEDLLGPALCEEIRGNDARGADCGAVEI